MYFVLDTAIQAKILPLRLWRTEQAGVRLLNFVDNRGRQSAVCPAGRCRLRGRIECVAVQSLVPKYTPRRKIGRLAKFPVPRPGPFGQLFWSLQTLPSPPHTSSSHSQLAPLSPHTTAASPHLPRFLSPFKPLIAGVVYRRPRSARMSQASASSFIDPKDPMYQALLTVDDISEEDLRPYIPLLSCPECDNHQKLVLLVSTKKVYFVKCTRCVQKGSKFYLPQEEEKKKCKFFLWLHQYAEYLMNANIAVPGNILPWIQKLHGDKVEVIERNLLHQQLSEAPKMDMAIGSEFREVKELICKQMMISASEAREVRELFGMLARRFQLFMIVFVLAVLVLIAKK